MFITAAGSRIVFPLTAKRELNAQIKFSGFHQLAANAIGWRFPVGFCRVRFFLIGYSQALAANQHSIAMGYALGA